VRPSSVWDIRRVNGEVTSQVAVYTGGPLADVDAVYYVEAGRATLEAGTQRIPVQPGSLVTVKKSTTRRFLEAEGGLRVLVFFGEGG
jgi:mannose-6-phosphate isomerase-like protein (cupin superfamily)